MKKISKFILYDLMGWEIVNEFPEDLKKYLIIAGPHTSNIDFPIGILAKFIKETDIKFIGKHTLFKPPFGFIFKALGGTPVDRSKSENRVQAIVDVFNNNEEFIFALSPEGTRKRVDRWKTGFYYVAKGANVPIVMIGLNFKEKKVVISDPYYPTDSIEDDFFHFHEFFKEFDGRYPEKFNADFYKNIK